MAAFTWPFGTKVQDRLNLPGDSVEWAKVAGSGVSLPVWALILKEPDPGFPTWSLRAAGDLNQRLYISLS